MTFIQEKKPDLYNDLSALQELKSDTHELETSPEAISPLITQLDSDEFRQVFGQFLEIKKQDKNFVFFWIYITMVEVLLAYVRADRTDCWDLHVNSFTRMLGPFERYDHFTYILLLLLLTTNS